MELQRVGHDWAVELQQQCFKNLAVPLPGFFLIQIFPGPSISSLMLQFTCLPFKRPLDQWVSILAPSPFDHTDLLSPGQQSVSSILLFFSYHLSCLSPRLNYTWDQVLCVYPLLLYHQSLGQLLVYSRCSISAGLMNTDCLLCAGHRLKSPGFRGEWLFSSPTRYILQER